MSENLIWDPDCNTIPGTLSNFKRILVQLLDWTHDDSTPFAVTNFKHGLSKLIENSRFTLKGKVDQLEFWTNTVDTVGNIPTYVWEDEDLSSLHPLVGKALLTNGIDFLDDSEVRDEWFTQAGTYCLKCPTSRGPKTESGAPSSSDQQPDGEESVRNNSSTVSPAEVRTAHKFHLDSATDEEWSDIQDLETPEAEGSDPADGQEPVEDQVETVGSLLARCGGPALASQIAPKGAKRGSGRPASKIKARFS
ncbi:hypothetical protein P7C70_g8207, partial [Phenoliferia sp. Uapishka_3]